MSGQGVGLHPKAGRQPGQAGRVGGEGAEGDQAAGPRGQANQGPQRCVEFRLTPDDHVSQDEPGEDLGDRTDLETRVRGDRQAGPSAPARCRVPGAQIRWLVAATHEDSGTTHRTRDRHGPNGQRQPRSVSTPLAWCPERAVPALLYDAPRASVQPDAD
jgi:hypothetical protein